MKWLTTDNGYGAVRLSDIPESDYAAFYVGVAEKLADRNCHVVTYFAVPLDNELVFFILIADDAAGAVLVGSHRYGYYSDDELESLSARHPQLHPFERDIAEQFGIRFTNNPWDKPLRFPHDSNRGSGTTDDYPFYSIEGESLHEVNVGPIHAGIIEPGAFRFICNGERVLHLEIALGYQHRGVERLMRETDNNLKRTILAESVAGDSAVAHATAFAMITERASGRSAGRRTELERAVGLELERIAMHIADTGALCMDIGYQMGQVASEALRTIIINTTQLWCGNRFGKGLVRPCGTNYPLTEEMAGIIRTNLAEVGRRYTEVREDLKRTQSLLARFEDCGAVSVDQMAKIGGVGPAARSSGLLRDVRATHPWGAFTGIEYKPELKNQGDVMARLMLRGREIVQSIVLINNFLNELSAFTENSAVASPDYSPDLMPETLSFSLVEGWRGEICHAMITDSCGAVAAYKIKDPSMHNWMALALAVRGEGISDFPICNKSFNLSYCGHDL